MRLGILDQSPVAAGSTPAQALQDTVELACQAEALGYHRYWLAEHHASAMLAGPCPEILAARVAAATTRLRVGAGGVLLPYYSPLKVAEVFRTLEALYPGRIDLGLGRAPGGHLGTALAINPDIDFGEDAHAQRVAETVGFLDATLPPGHPHRSVPVMPQVPGRPQVWILGSTDFGAALAADLGLHYAYAHFISPQGAAPALRAYREGFRPLRESAPRALLAVAAVCADSEVEAREAAAPWELHRVRSASGADTPLATPREALEQLAALDGPGRDTLAAQRRRVLVGAPEALAPQLRALATQCGADELVLLTVTAQASSRLRSYRLLAAALGTSG